MNIWEIIFLFFSFQAIIVAVVLFFRKSHIKQANVIWGFFLLLFAYNIFYNVLYWSKFDTYLNRRLVFIYLIPFSLYGGLFFIYIRSLVTLKKLKVTDTLHLIPFIVVMISYGGFYFLSLETRELYFNQGTLRNYILFPEKYLVWFLASLLLVYAYLSYKIFKKNYEGDLEMRIWLKLITFLFAGFGVSWFLFFGLLKLGILEKQHDYLISFMMVLFIATTTYFGFIHSKVFSGKSLVKIFPLLKYYKSGLSEGMSVKFQEKLLNIMDTEAPHLDSDLRLVDLAERMNINRHHASQIINENFNMSFFEFINKYRIQEAERMIKNIEKENLKLVDIAYRSGFNNRITFYKAFKNIKGISPSEYRKKIVEEIVLSHKN